MNIQYKIKGAEVCETDKRYAEKKAQTLLKYINANEMEVRCDIEFTDGARGSKDAHRVDMVIVAPALDMHAVGRGETVRAAIDTARDELASRLRRKKRKEVSLLRKGGRLMKRLLRRGEY